MKQSILFENGKLYVVELPEKPTQNCYGKPDCCMYRRCKHLEYNTVQAIAIKNKVEVKNPELLPFIMVTTTGFKSDNVDFGKQLTDGDTFPLPDGIEVEIKEEETVEDGGGCFVAGSRDVAILKRIEPEKSIARRIYDETPQEVKDKVIAYGNEVVKKSQETLTWEFINMYESLKNTDELAVPELLKSFTIQRKKS